MKENWTYKKLGEVCEILDSKRKPITKSDRQSGSIPYYGATGVQDYVKDFIFDGRFLLVGEDGAKWGKDENTAYIIEGKSWVNNHAHILKLHDSVLDTFVRYYLNGKDLTPYITGAVVQKLTQAALISIPIPVPPLPEQKHIVSELDLLQSIIEKQQAQLKELDKLAQAVFYDMFGDPVENEKGWEKKPLQEICERITDGSHFSPKEDAEGIIPMLSVKDMGSNGFVYDNCKFINEYDYSLLVANGCKPLYNDVLVAKDGSYLKTAFVLKEEREQAVLSSIAILKPIIELVCPDYLAFFFRMPQTKLVVERHYLTGTAIKRVILKGFKEIQMALPPLSLQQSFAAKIESIEKQKAAISQSIAETQKLFDYTMDKYFG